jgi:hypothetical protein
MKVKTDMKAGEGLLGGGKEGGGGLGGIVGGIIPDGGN